MCHTGLFTIVGSATSRQRDLSCQSALGVILPLSALGVIAASPEATTLPRLACVYDELPYIHSPALFPDPGTGLMGHPIFRMPYRWLRIPLR